MVAPNDPNLPTRVRPAGGLREPSRPTDAAGTLDPTATFAAKASPVRHAQDPGAEETRVSEGATSGPLHGFQGMSLGAPHPPPRNPTEGELLRSEALLAQTLAHDSTHAGPVIDLGSDRVGRYAVLSKLGQGGMGAVYTAYDEELDRRVALKLVREPSGVDTLGHARMQREAQAMARLSHPNVVQIYDVGSHEGQIFIAMEFVRGSTLRAWQERHDPATPAGRRAILDMYIQAGRGLAAAHRAGMVHRDFKPKSRPPRPERPQLADRLQSPEFGRS